MHHPLSRCPNLRQVTLRLLLIVLVMSTPDLAMAQASPFLTGATALQTNARVAREYLVALPVELSPEQRLDLVRGFSRELTDRYGFALDVAIHAPRDFPGSDPRNFHAHLLATTREVTPEGLGAKTTLEMSDEKRSKLGLKPVIHELLHVRERWAAVANQTLEAAHIAARIDHRSLAAQGLDREPLHIPRAAFEMERHGFRSAVAERLRERYQSRMQERLDKSASNTAQPDEPQPPAEAPVAKPQSLEDIRREARENWLKLRQKQMQGSAESAAAPSKGRGRDDDITR